MASTVILSAYEYANFIQHHFEPNKLELFRKFVPRIMRATVKRLLETRGVIW